MLSCNNENPLGQPLIDARTKSGSGFDAACQALGSSSNALALVSANTPFIEESKAVLQQKLPKTIQDVVEVIPSLETYRAQNPERITFRFQVRYKGKPYPICYRYGTAIGLRRTTRITGRMLKTAFATAPFQTEPHHTDSELVWPDPADAIASIAKELELDLLPTDIENILAPKQEDGITNQDFHGQKCLILEDKTLVPGWYISFSHAGRSYHGDATASKAIRAEKQFFEITGDIQVYKHGKVGSSSGLETVEIKNMSSGGSLCSSQFVTEYSDQAARAFSSSGHFVFSPTDTRFQEASLFANASLMGNWFLQSMGQEWTGPRLTLLLQQDSNGVPDNGINNRAVYLPAKNGTSPRIELGRGDGEALRNLRLDPDVVSHELGHHFVYKTLQSTSGESVIVHEGLADFFVFANTKNTCLGESICPQGGSVCRSTSCLRSAQHSMRYDDPDLPSEAHKKSQVVSAALWDMLETFGEDKILALVFQSLAYLTSESGLLDYWTALLTADSELNDGKNACEITTMLNQRGFAKILDGLDCKDYGPAQ